MCCAVFSHDCTVYASVDSQATPTSVLHRHCLSCSCCCIRSSCCYMRCTKCICHCIGCKYRHIRSGCRHDHTLIKHAASAITSAANCLISDRKLSPCKSKSLHMTQCKSYTHTCIPCSVDCGAAVALAFEISRLVPCRPCRQAALETRLVLHVSSSS